MIQIINNEIELKQQVVNSEKAKAIIISVLTPGNKDYQKYFSYIQKIVHNSHDAEDIMQNFLLNLFNRNSLMFKEKIKDGGINENPAIDAYIYKSLRNKSFNLLKRDKFRNRSVNLNYIEDNTEDKNPTPYQLILANELEDILKNALFSLESIFKESLELGAELPYAEIERKYGIPVGTTKSRIHKAREKIAVNLPKEYQSIRSKRYIRYLNDYPYN